MANKVLILDEAVCISHSVNSFEKDMNPIILPSAMGYRSIVSQTKLFNLGVETSLVFYTHDLRNLMNERTHFFIKIYFSHFILERVDVSVVCERWVERYILRERTSSFHIFFQEPGGANTCTPFASRDTSDWLRVPCSTAILCTLSKSDCVVLITWSPFGYSPVVPECPDRATVYSSKCDSLPKPMGSLETNWKSMSYVI